MKILTRINQTVFLSITAIGLSGCWSLSGSDSSNKTSFQVNSPKPTLLTTEAELQKTQKQLETLISEWDSVKTDINKVIEMESELGYILEQLNKQNQLTSLQRPNVKLAEYTTSNMRDVSDSPEEAMGSDLVAAANALNQKVEVQKATPVGVDTSNNDTVIDDKLSNSAINIRAKNNVQASTSSVNQLSAQNSIDAKFSSTNAANQQLTNRRSTKSIVGPISYAGNSATQNSKNLKRQNKDPLMVSSSCSSSSNGDIGIHLISLKDKNKISGATSALLDKYEAHLCDSIKINEVVVQGENFYSVRFGPYSNKQAAQDACSKIRASGQYCGLTKFEGRLL